MIQENSGVGRGMIITCLRRGRLAIHDTCSAEAVDYGQAITKKCRLPIKTAPQYLRLKETPEICPFDVEAWILPSRPE